MKQFFLLIIISTFSYTFYAQKVIQMEKSGGVYKIPCRVNGAKMKLIFDTGASTVCISETMADYLYENDYLLQADILGTGSSSFADGRIVDNVIINLRDIEIAGLHLKNIRAVVIEGQKAPLLLGQTAIQELGRIIIDGDRLTILNVENEYNKDEIKKLVVDAEKYIDDNSFSAAIECYLKVDDNWGLSPIGLRNLAFCYSVNKQYSECLRICKRWVAEHEKKSDDTEKLLIYGYMADCYYFWVKDYNQSVLWFQKVIFLAERDSSTLSTAQNKFFLASSYYELQRYHEAKAMYKEAIKDECSYLGITISDVRLNKVKEEELGFMFYEYAYCLNMLKEYSDGDELLILSAKCGNKFAIKDCEKYKLNYKQISNELFD